MTESTADKKFEQVVYHPGIRKAIR